MELIDIPFNSLRVNINNIWYDKWFLLTSGDWETGHFNTMTVAWGFLGIMWNKPLAVVVVRPGRYTFEFIEKYEDFTLSAFDSRYRKDLTLLGSKSGRDGDKISETNLNVIPSNIVASPSFKEAELIIECKKIYWDDLKPEHFINPLIDNNYPKKDYHRIYYGETLNISGIEKYYSDQKDKD